jgi:hypothetical protein
MKRRAYAKRSDNNQKEIVAALREIDGMRVEVIEEPVDLMVGYMHTTWLFEIKNPETSHGITKKQQEFIDTWTGGRPHVVESVLEIINIVTGSAFQNV